MSRTETRPLAKAEVETAAELPPWATEVFASFRANVESPEPAFPCVFGVHAFRENGLRYVFLEDESSDELARLGEALAAFLRAGRTIGRYVSLVAFFRPSGANRLFGDWERTFWRVLQYLHDHDPEPWPAAIPPDADDDLWEFSFAGTPMFVVCNTPEHGRRLSRRAGALTITFQPRWVFDGLHGTTPAGQKARRTIRARLHRYDTVPPSPRLGDYGAAGNREWHQYFLPDDNETPPPSTCPLSIARSGGERA